MIEKLRQLARDETLRRWLVARMLGRAHALPAFVPHWPPYLAGIPASSGTPQGNFRELSTPAPSRPIVLPLAGLPLGVRPEDSAAPFARDFSDTETLLALHRFAWIPVLGPEADPAWVAALWREWRARFAIPDESWAWHPYTAAERAVNLLCFARRHGLPEPAGDTRAVLASHAPTIAARLEYFGEANTGNHLANNGRGLFALGLELGLPDYADLGARIMIEEAKRIFRPSGILREGSSHYHLLLARDYADAWLWARRHGHASASQLEEILRRTLAVVPRLSLPGGFPLVGDVSPDCPPEHLRAFLPGDDARCGWGALVDDSERADFLALKSSVAPCAAEALAVDGWRSAAFGEWHALWFLSPEGFAPMPGHGHQDAGSFEVHWRGAPLFVDVGRGAYGETGEAALHRSALVHNGLTLDDHDPYPPNKPYYDPAFRRREGGESPMFVGTRDGVIAAFGGYGRLGAPEVERLWRFDPGRFVVEDRIEGHGARRIARRLHTPWPVEPDGQAAVVRAPGGAVRVFAEAGGPALRSVTRWKAYGSGVPATAIVFESTAALPWRGTLVVEAT